MKIKENICQTGGKTDSNGRIINEDGLIHFEIYTESQKSKYIVLMDGASGLGKNNEFVKNLTSAEWYVQFMLKEFKNLFTRYPNKPINPIVKECILHATKFVNDYEQENNIILEEYEKPSASLAILKQNSDYTELYLLGDTETIIGYKNGMVERVNNPNQKAVQNNDNKVLKRMKELVNIEKYDFIDSLSKQEIKEMLQTNRSKKNQECSGGYWICGTDKNAVDHGISLTLKNTEIDGIILASDGFNYSLLGINEEEVYKSIKQYGADYIVRKIREIENNDEKCNKFPRFKKSDDLTIVVADFNEREYEENHSLNKTNIDFEK